MVPRKLIFISYRRKDNAFAAAALSEVLRRRLPKGSYDVFRDVEAIQSGDPFKPAIANAMSNAMMILVLIGKDWKFTGFVRKEIIDAQNQSIRQIPVLMDVHEVDDLQPWLEDPNDEPALTKLFENQ
jgi:hypothetical protein